MRLTELRRGLAFPITETVVELCLLPDNPADELFRRAWQATLGGKPRRIPPAVSPVIGAVAESVAAVLLADHGHTIVWQLTGGGQHGIDLLTLDPGGTTLVAWEVKGTLRCTGFPRLRGGRPNQMSVEWLDRLANDGMVEWDLASRDVVGGFMVVSLAQLQAWARFTTDHEYLQVVTAPDQLGDLGWLLG